MTILKAYKINNKDINSIDRIIMLTHKIKLNNQKPFSKITEIIMQTNIEIIMKMQKQTIKETQNIKCSITKIKNMEIVIIRKQDIKQIKQYKILKI